MIKKEVKEFRWREIDWFFRRKDRGNCPHCRWECHPTIKNNKKIYVCCNCPWMVTEEELWGWSPTVIIGDDVCRTTNNLWQTGI